MLLTAYEIRLALGGPWVGGLALGGPWVGRWEDLGRWFEEASKRKEAFGQVRLLRGYPLIAFYLAAAPTISILQPRLRLRPRLPRFLRSDLGALPCAPATLLLPLLHV